MNNINHRMFSHRLLGQNRSRTLSTYQRRRRTKSSGQSARSSAAPRWTEVRWSNLISHFYLSVSLSSSRPKTSFLWFTSPWKTLRYVIWRNFKWHIILGVMLVIFVIFLLLALWSLPGEIIRQISNKIFKVTPWTTSLSFEDELFYLNKPNHIDCSRCT